MSRGIIEKLARFFHEHFSLDHDKECSSWPKDGCQVCISAAHEFLPILAQEREKVREKCAAAIQQGKYEGRRDEWNIAYNRAIRDGSYAIRQLDLTKDLVASSREEKG